MKPSRDLITVTCRVTPTQKQDTHTEDICLLLHSISARNQQWGHNLQYMLQVVPSSRVTHVSLLIPCGKVWLYATLPQKHFGIATVWDMYVPADVPVMRNTLPRIQVLLGSAKSNILVPPSQCMHWACTTHTSRKHSHNQ